MKADFVAKDGLAMLLRELKLPSFVANHQALARRGEQEGWSFNRYLQVLAEQELEERRQRRIERLVKRSHLPSGKTLATLEAERLPAGLRRQLPELCEGHFLKECKNILAFGLPGRGKTHVLSAIGFELIQRGHAVLFIPAHRLVQRLLGAKRELELDKELRHLDSFDAVIIDDIGYVQQDREEMEVLFTFLAERYERKSIMITSNLIFSQWDRIFKDPMTTAAAIDRLVHHCIIIELSGESYRARAAKRGRAAAGNLSEEQAPAQQRP